MAHEATPTEDDYTAISQIARDLLLVTDPTGAYDPGPTLQLIENGERAIVLREDGWHPNGNDGDDSDTLPSNIVGWAIAHNRAEGRVDGHFALERSDKYNEHAAQLLAFIEKSAHEILAERDSDETTIVSQTGAKDSIRQAVLKNAGFEKAREWLFMERDLTEEDDTPDIPDDIIISRILTEEQRRKAHDVLETSFRDHFASYVETFEEFEARIDTYPGHDWAHDFIAEVEIDGELIPVGTLVTGWQPVSSTALPEYLGVTSEARGRGVAKALFQAFYANARQFGFAKAELEVDADSPTKAHEIYEALGFREDYRLETWHKTITRNK